MRWVQKYIWRTQEHTCLKSRLAFTDVEVVTLSMPKSNTQTHSSNINQSSSVPFPQQEWMIPQKTVVMSSFFFKQNNAIEIPAILDHLNVTNIFLSIQSSIEGYAVKDGPRFGRLESTGQNSTLYLCENHCIQPISICQEQQKMKGGKKMLSKSKHIEKERVSRKQR